MTYPRIIGISGKAQHGKDTLAGILTSLYGYEKIAFADSLRACLLALDPIVGNHPLGWDMADPSDIPVHLSEALRDEGYEGAKKKYPEYTRLLQNMGTEVGREILGQDIWVETTFRNAPKGKLLVIPDVRFPNEFRAVQERGGQVWRINRVPAPPLTRNGDHPSETSLDNYVFDQVITNDTSSMAGLADRVMDILDGQQITALTRREFFAGTLE